MHYWKLFARLLLTHPERVIIWLFWLIQGKRKRARNRLGLLQTHVHCRYRKWQQKCEQKCLNTINSEDIREDISFLIALSEYETTGNNDASLRSLTSQTYTNWSFYDADVRNQRPALGSYDFLVWLRKGDTLPQHALKTLALTIQTNPEADIFFSDHDYIAPNGRREFPYFKGAWNYGLLLSTDYIFGLCAVRGKTIANIKRNLQSELFSWRGRYRLLVELGRDITIESIHIPHILYHCHKGAWGHPQENLLQPPGTSASLNSVLKANNLAIQRNNYHSITTSSKSPLISIIIPTRDRLSLLSGCIDSVLQKTTYDNYELLIVDNDSLNPETLRYFEQISEHPQVRIIHFPGSFNFSALCNFGVAHCKGELICLLNNDTEIITPDWLTHLARWADQDNVGAVGAKLLYADKRIQHAGIITGLGQMAGHAHRNLPDKDPGYFFQAHVSRYVTAVTAACLLVSKEKYLDVGGMDEKNFAVAFNDVDLCLKLDSAGLNNVYEPRAVLYHFESRSRGKDNTGKKLERYMREVSVLQKKWSTCRFIDRYYSPHFETETEDFSIKTE